MKKVLMLFALVIGMNTVASAQDNGSVFVINHTSCNMAIDVVAKCVDDCSTNYSSLMMTPVPPNGGFPGMHLYDATLPTPNPYFNTPDPETICPGQWNWSYADIVYFCAGVAHTITIGNPNDPCNTYPTEVEIASDACINECYEGRPIRFKWSRNHGMPGSTSISIGY